MPGDSLRLDDWAEFRERFLLLRRRVLNRADGEDRKLLLNQLPPHMKRLVLEEEHKRRQRSWLVRLHGLPPTDIRDLQASIDEAIQGHVHKVDAVTGGILVTCGTQQLFEQVLGLHNSRWDNHLVTATRADFTLTGDDIILLVGSRLEMEESLRDHSADIFPSTSPMAQVSVIEQADSSFPERTPYRPSTGYSGMQEERPGPSPGPRLLVHQHRRHPHHGPGSPGEHPHSFGKGDIRHFRDTSSPRMTFGTHTCAHCYHRGWNHCHAPSVCHVNPFWKKPISTVAQVSRTPAATIPTPSVPTILRPGTPSDSLVPKSPRRPLQ